MSPGDRTSGNQQLNKSRGSGLGNSRLVVVVVELVTVECDEVAAGDVVVINITARNVHLHMPLTKYITDENGQPPSRNM